MENLKEKQYHRVLYLALSCAHLHLATGLISEHVVCVIVAMLYAMLAISVAD